MALTKSQYIGIILLAVNGGEFSGDVRVRDPDVAAYLQIAINGARRRYALENRELLIRQGGRKLLEAVSFYQELLETFEVTPVFSEDEGLYFAKLPVQISFLAGFLGIEDAWPKNRNRQYIKINNRADVQGMEYLDETFFWYERFKDEPRMYFLNIGIPVCNVLVRLVPSFLDVDDNSTIELPPGMEILVVQMCVEHFRGQRQMPADLIPDEEDDIRKT